MTLTVVVIPELNSGQALTIRQLAMYPAWYMAGGQDLS